MEYKEIVNGFIKATKNYWKHLSKKHTSHIAESKNKQFIKQKKLEQINKYERIGKVLKEQLLKK
jgi:hypothetical protein